MLQARAITSAKPLKESTSRNSECQGGCSGVELGRVGALVGDEVRKATRNHITQNPRGYSKNPGFYFFSGAMS